MSLNKPALLIFVILIVVSVGAFLFIQSKTKNIPGIGEMCGGFANIQCPLGLKCVSPKEVYPDIPGTCEVDSISYFYNYLQINKGNEDVSQGNNEDEKDIAQGGTKPIVGEDGTTTYCIEFDNDGSCRKTETVYSVKGFVGGIIIRGEEVKVKGVADEGQGVCTLRGCSTANPCCNSCGSNMVIRDKNDVSRENIISNLIIEGDSEVLSCGGNECKMECRGPLKVGQEYIFTGILDGEVKYYDNDEPYITDKFVIKNYEISK